jgi:hypothetical protein
MPRARALVDEIANELDTWPGVQIESRRDGSAVVRYERFELGVLFPDDGRAELPEWGPEGAALIEEGDAEPADGTGDDPERVAHEIEGPSDVTAVLALFDQRYRELTGAGEPYSSQDPGFGGPGESN